jgi:hypothetical protein
MAKIVGPNFYIFGKYRYSEVPMHLSIEEKDYLADILEQVYKDMSQEERKDIRLIVELFEKKVAYERTHMLANSFIMNLFRPLRKRFDDYRNSYLDFLGELKQKDRLFKTAEKYAKLVEKEAVESKAKYIGEIFTRLLNLLIIDIRAYNYEGSQFSSKTKNFINHKTFNIIRKAPFFDAVIHGAVYELDDKLKTTHQATREKELICKILLQEAYSKLSTSDKKKIKPLINSYGSVVNLSELASRRDSNYNPYLETLYDYEKSNFELAFESLRQDPQITKIVKNYSKILLSLYKHEKFEKKTFELLGKKLSKLLTSYVQFVQKPTKYAA